VRFIKNANLLCTFIHTLPFESLESLSYFCTEINTFIQQGCIKLIESESKEMYNVTTDFY